MTSTNDIHDSNYTAASVAEARAPRDGAADWANVNDGGKLPTVLIVAPSIRIMGGQAVMAKQLLDDFHSSGVRADFQPINPEPPGILGYAERIKYLRTLVVSICYVLQLFRRVPRYDIVHIFSASYFSFIIAQTPAILISRFYGKAIVLNYHSGQADDHLRRWGQVVYAILRLVDRIVVQSEYLVKVFKEHGFESVAIANVVNVDAFPFVERETFRPHVLVPRMLDPIYNVGCSIRAFQIVKQQFPEARLTLLGDGPQEASLRKLVRELQIDDVAFAGRVEREQISDVYRQHDVFLNSSNVDNMPISILEAFASGLPVVTTAAGGIPYMIRDRETGHLAPLDDHVALAERLLEVLRDQPATRELVHSARNQLQHYQWPAVAPQWFELYNGLSKHPVAS